MERRTEREPTRYGVPLRRLADGEGPAARAMALSAWYGALYRALGLQFHRRSPGWSFGFHCRPGAETGQLTIGVLDEAFGEVVEAWLRAGAPLDLPDGRWGLDARREPSRALGGHDGEVLVRTVSPVFVRDPDSPLRLRSLPPSSPRWEAELERLARKAVSAYWADGATAPLTVRWVYTERMSTVRVHETPVVAWHGLVALRGAPALVARVRAVGLGAKRGLGFGCIAGRPIVRRPAWRGEPARVTAGGRGEGME